jgi:hypothetical protein
VVAVIATSWQRLSTCRWTATVTSHSLRLRLVSAFMLPQHLPDTFGQLLFDNHWPLLLTVIIPLTQAEVCKCLHVTPGCGQRPTDLLVMQVPAGVHKHLGVNVHVQQPLSDAQCTLLHRLCKVWCTLLCSLLYSNMLAMAGPSLLCNYDTACATCKVMVLQQLGALSCCQQQDQPARLATSE